MNNNSPSPSSANPSQDPSSQFTDDLGNRQTKHQFVVSTQMVRGKGSVAASMGALRAADVKSESEKKTSPEQNRQGLGQVTLRKKTVSPPEAPRQDSTQSASGKFEQGVAYREGESYPDREIFRIVEPPPAPLPRHMAEYSPDDFEEVDDTVVEEVRTEKSTSSKVPLVISLICVAIMAILWFFYFM